MIHLDTHVLVWLVGGELARLTPAARNAIEREQVAWSPMAALELTYLHEIGRITAPASDVLEELARALDAVEDKTPFPQIVRSAQTVTWTRDPFDRLIAGHALAAGASLVTADERIREALPRATLW